MKLLYKRFCLLFTCLCCLLGLTGCKGATYTIDYQLITLNGEECYRIVGLSDINYLWSDKIEVNLPATYDGLPVRVIGESALCRLYSYNLAKVTIPEGITVIEEDAFLGAEIKSLTIPDSVTDIGRGAFGMCVELEEVHIGSGAYNVHSTAFTFASPKLKRITVSQDNVKLYGNGQYIVDCTTGELLASCVDAELPNDGSIKIITEYLFGELNFSFGYFRVPDGVTEIRSWAFNRCANLQAIVIPQSLQYVHSNAFNECSSLEVVYYGGNETDWENFRSGISSDNGKFSQATVYYYSQEEKPSDSNYWHFDGGGYPALW